VVVLTAPGRCGCDGNRGNFCGAAAAASPQAESVNRESPINAIHKRAGLSVASNDLSPTHRLGPNEYRIEKKIMLIQLHSA
jgi:hypothetical protein